MMDVTAVGRAEIQIQGVETGLYLAVTRRGKLYGEVGSIE